MRTKEELRKEFDFDNKALKLKEAPFWMLYSQFLEQKLIDQSQEPKQTEVSEELQYQNLTCLVHGFELTTYQKGLAKQEYDTISRDPELITQMVEYFKCDGVRFLKLDF